MKTKIFFGLTVFAVLLCSKASAQGTLQFNQVLTYEVLNLSPVAFTVPAGKVWKIESTGAGGTSCGFVLRNSSAEWLGYLWDNSPSIMLTQPLWLPSNFSGDFYVFNCSGSKAFASIIEFNVVP